MIELLAPIAAYVIGSIPTGLWLGRLAGVDVRAAGSGNIGASNVGRILGLRLGLTTLVVDVFKGAFAVLLGKAVSEAEWMPALCGMAAFYGHIFSIFAGLKGGKGVATAAGAFLALAPGVLAVALVVFALVGAAARIVSLASLAAAITLPLAALLTGQSQAVTGAAFVAGVTIVATHRENIARLRRGTEPRFSTRK